MLSVHVHLETPLIPRKAVSGVFRSPHTGAGRCPTPLPPCWLRWQMGDKGSRGSNCNSIFLFFSFFFYFTSHVVPSTLTCRFLLEARRARAGLAGVRQAVTPAWKHPTVCRQSLTSLLPPPPPRERYHQCLPRQFSSESSCVGLLLASHCLVVHTGGKNNSPTVIEALW